MAGLSAKQKVELNQAIHEYLLKNQYTNSAEMFASEADLPEASKPISTRLNGTGGIQDILEKKWTSVVKMKKQVMDLEK
jgi:platelet-activating factor acetylhydrolase IB subunit alpha